MLEPPNQLPQVTATLPGTGGVIRSEPEDFRVVEIPAYTASGEGDHVLAVVEKRGVTTFDAVRRLAEALGISDRDVGTAGLKDKLAVTEQQISLPPPCTPEQVLALGETLEGIRILSAARHGNKLRTGHLRGNRFVLRIRDTAVDADTAAERARAILAELSRWPGSPNWYGEQRFGRDARNAEVGRALITGQRVPGRPPRGRQKRLMISAYQSLLFNEYLRRRLDDGLYRTVIGGDVLEKRTGGLFITDGPDVDQARLDAGEVVPTGPMFGPKMKAPPAGSAAATRESDLLAADGVAIADFARAGKLAAGTRRALAVDLGETSAVAAGERAIDVTFQLPAGSYATAVLGELVKGPTC